MDRAGNSPANGPARIVVGVDGSPSSRAALGWALRQARLVGGTLDAVITWDYPALYGWEAPMQDAGFSEYAGKVLADCVHEALGDDIPVEIREMVELGNAAQVLLETSRTADLLVLGSRGLGGFAGATLGSVSQHCVQHATCPVVIVRDQER